MISQVVIDTPPAPVDPLAGTPQNVAGMTLPVVYAGTPIKFTARLPWCTSAVANQVAILYLANAADSVRQYGETEQVPLASKNFTFHIDAPALDSIRTASGLWVPMIIGTTYTFKLQWAFAISAKLVVQWAAGSEFFGFFEAA